MNVEGFGGIITVRCTLGAIGCPVALPTSILVLCTVSRQVQSTKIFVETNNVNPFDKVQRTAILSDSNTKSNILPNPTFLKISSKYSSKP